MEDLLAWQNHCWLWNIRGLNCSQHRVLAYEVERAGDDGVVVLNQATIARKCELSMRRVQEIIGEIERLGFHKRKARFARKGHQLANTYQLQTSTWHPADDVGGRLWKSILSALAKKKDEAHSVIQMHAEGSTAYYKQSEKCLIVWLDNPRSHSFFKVRHTDLSTIIFELDPPVKTIELIYPFQRSRDKNAN